MDNRIFAAKCEDYDNAARAVNRVLEAYGGAKGILGSRKTVLLKPNLIMPRKPEDAATTHPAVIEAICRAFVDAGAKVELIDSTGGPHTKFVLNMLCGKTGMKTAMKQGGGKISLSTKSRTITVPEARVMKKMKILSPGLDSDLVISVAKAKTHGFMSMTGCVKNLFGLIPGLGKPRLHGKYSKREDFAGMLVDICQTVNPGFCFLDAVWGMEGPGPTGGTPKYLGAILGGYSPYVIDLAQCHLMGLRQDTVLTIIEAKSRGLGPADITEITWLGDDPEPLRSNFKPASSNKNDSVPFIKDNCTGCGNCARICPAKCIKNRNKKAVIDDSKCIRCYCCHEFCPAKAILI